MERVPLSITSTQEKIMIKRVTETKEVTYYYCDICKTSVKTMHSCIFCGKDFCNSCGNYAQTNVLSEKIHLPIFDATLSVCHECHTKLKKDPEIKLLRHQMEEKLHKDTYHIYWEYFNKVKEVINRDKNE